WPILLNTAAGVRQLDPRWLQLSRSLAATPWETLRRVILPGILGHVLTGVRLAIGILWIVLVPCEMLGVSAGRVRAPPRRAGSRAGRSAA
ncbi:ABC transporter permease, partial [Pseudomonas aeruginosa]